MAIPEKPISRIEHYLARANGQNVQPPDPISRIEQYLEGIAGGVPQELLDDVADLKSALNYKIDTVENVYNLADVTHGGYYNTSGVWVDDRSYYSSDFIPVLANERYCLPYSQSVCLWDENKTFISTKQTNTGKPFTIPNNTNIRYLTFFGILNRVSKDMLIKGDYYPSNYLPYNEKIDSDTLVGNENETKKIRNELNRFISDGNIVINLFDKDSAIRGYFYSNGVLTPNESLYSTDFIPVENGKKYYINPSYLQSISMWDENKNFINSISAPGGVYENSWNAAYITTFGLLTNIDSDMVCEYRYPNNIYVPYGKVYAEIFNPETKNKNTTVAMLGDSITWYDGHTYPNTSITAVGYESYLRLLGYEIVQNKGVSGACIAYHSESQYTDIVTTAQNTDFSDIDIVIVAGGVNDFKFWNSSIGQIASSNYDSTTVIGALQIIIEKILTDNANAKIALFTPLKCSGWENTNQAGNKLIDYSNAIKAVAEYYSIPVLDLTLISGFNNVTIPGFTIDGLHPNNDGYKMVSQYKMMDFVNNL